MKSLPTVTVRLDKAARSIHVGKAPSERVGEIIFEQLARDIIEHVLEDRERCPDLLIMESSTDSAEESSVIHLNSLVDAFCRYKDNATTADISDPNSRERVVKELLVKKSAARRRGLNIQQQQDQKQDAAKASNANN